jgi:hypothetical protein
LAPARSRQDHIVQSSIGSVRKTARLSASVPPSPGCKYLNILVDRKGLLP